MTPIGKCPNCNSRGYMLTSGVEYCPKCKHQWFPGSNAQPLPPPIKYTSGCMGPTYSEYQANEAYDKIMKILKDEYSIQTYPGLLDCSKVWAERNEVFRAALHKLFELES